MNNSTKEITKTILQLADLPLILQTHLDNQSFHHAYLFTGPRFSNKRIMARSFSELVFEKMNWQPEVIEFDFAETSKLDELRQVIKQTSLTGSQNGKRVVLFYNFEQASPAAASALLKTIEEPAMSTMIIMVANQASVIPTIVSRSLVVRFSKVGSQQLDQDTDSVLQKLTGAFSSGLAERLLLLTELSTLTKEQLTSVLTAWLQTQRKLLSQNKEALLNCRLTQNTILALQTNRNLKLVLQDFLLKTKI